MGRPFSTADAKRMIEEHRRLTEELNTASVSVEKFREEIKKASDAIDESKTQACHLQIFSFPQASFFRKNHKKLLTIDLGSVRIPYVAR